MCALPANPASPLGAGRLSPYLIAAAAAACACAFPSAKSRIAQATLHGVTFVASTCQPMPAQREPLSEPPPPSPPPRPAQATFAGPVHGGARKKKLRVERRAPRVKVSHGRCRHVIAGEASSSSA
ncbi:hypothetical protein COCVIDRAFT_107224 [Bipolaris victoriae FI3]|uniref:Uncharacterized protein n=1 Tax=Bipolaris victoriae (strain FI3) TaxID=930091 RepID=W7E102_BIPV3|nr:hypothetical protein COCVIDRAFT_107224 [Bipolaris victoriae FI3]